MYLTPQDLDAQMPDGANLLSIEPEMESSLHYAQLVLLVTCLELLWQGRSDYFLGANLTIYYSRQQLRSQDFRGPDLFLVKDTANHPRKSWVTWEEGGRYPSLIVELLSESTAKVDRTLKKTLYQDIFHTAEYFWFSPDSLEFEGFRLGSQGYEAIVPTSQGWRWSEELGLYLGIEAGQLRYFSITGGLIPTPQEAEQQQRQRAERLAEQLRSLGVEPDLGED
ncbi:MAG TPA: Uma2 family endonuclease [Thermosynechococcaceae cyanobacterium]